jgi:hypothetical protein
MRIFFTILLSSICSLTSQAWSDHPIMARFALQHFIDWDKVDSVEAKSLEQFLMQSGPALEAFLEQQEQRMRKLMPDYAPRPDELAFVAGGDTTTIVTRFLNAIRLNPNSKMPLYLFLMPDESVAGRTIADPSEISTLRNVESMRHSVYVWITAGEPVHPFQVLTSANNEPDYGFDLGLFEDNQTDYGAKYGFGQQPFGNPNLEYSSQAPFHMGFYHESKMLYTFGPFLKHTFLDYRVNLFRELAAFAFEQEQAYWGWRFMGWSMHYAADATMPYHCQPLPGYSTLRMIWINLKAMLGFKKSRDNAVQLVSNKHTIIEAYQWQETRRAYLAGETQHQFFQALQNPGTAQPFTHSFVRDVVSRRAVDQAVNFDRVIKRNMPFHMVADPSVEVSDLPELDQIAAHIRQSKGNEVADELNRIIANRFSDLSLTLRSLMYSVLDESSWPDEVMATRLPV